MVQVDRSRTSVQTESSPVPHLKSENIRRCANFQHHAVTPRTMRSSRRNQKVVMLLRRELVDILLRVELYLPALCPSQIADHLLAIDTILHPEIYSSFLSGIQQVIALVLGIVHSELFLDVLDQWVHLER